MRKTVVALLLIVLAAGMGFARGNAEKLTEVEGPVVGIVWERTRAQVTVRTDAGEQIVVEVPAGEVERLRLRIETRIRVAGVLIGVPEAQQTRLRTRMLARIVNVDGEDVTVEKPLRLTTQERLQIREYEQEHEADPIRDQDRIQDRDQDQDPDQDQSRQQTQARDGSGQ